MMVEKVWAKINGNYESISTHGSADEFYSFIAGMPTRTYLTKGISDINSDVEKLYSVI
jgi:hypothetical protein